MRAALTRDSSATAPGRTPRRQPPIITRAGLRCAAGAIAGRLDAGWLFILAGMTLLAAITLIPAQMQLDQARQARDQAGVAADFALRRLTRASDFLDRLRVEDPALLEALAVDQLREAPAGKSPIEPFVRPAGVAGGPLAWIEPTATPVSAAGPLGPTSMLARMATNSRARLATMALAAALVFAGLLPPATERKRSVGSPARGAASQRRRMAPWRHRRALRVDLTGRRWRSAVAFPRRTPGYSR